MSYQSSKIGHRLSGVAILRRKTGSGLLRHTKCSGRSLVLSAASGPFLIFTHPSFDAAAVSIAFGYSGHGTMTTDSDSLTLAAALY
jgi:hypothetical protein